MTNPFTSLAAMTAVKLTGDVVSRSIDAARSIVEGPSFLQVLRSEADGEGESVANLREQLRDWLSELKLPGPSISFGRDAGGTLSVTPNDRAAEIEFRLRENPSLHHDLLAELTRHPSQSLEVAI